MTDQELLAPRHDVPEAGRSGFLHEGTRQVHYLEWGPAHAPTVLLLHGGGQTAYMWEQLGVRLRDRLHVLAPDLPGHGDTDPIDDFGRHSLADAARCLLDAFGVEEAAVVGASLGGITALTLAASSPQRVAGIVLVDVGHRLEERGVQRIIDFMREHESFASLEEAAEAIAEYLPRRGPVDPDRLTRNLRQREDGRWVFKHVAGRRLRAEQEAGEDPAQNWRHILEGLEDDARALSVPALVIRGHQSDVLSDEGAADVAELIPDAQLALVEGAGHLAAGDNPEQTNQLIDEFLAGLDW